MTRLQEAMARYVRHHPGATTAEVAEATRHRPYHVMLALDTAAANGVVRRGTVGGGAYETRWYPVEAAR